MQKKKYILIVDDSNANLLMMCDMLELEGYNTFSANSGKLALAFLEDNIPDLILLDIMMPEMSGFEVCEKIKQNKKLSEIPLMFLTAVIEIGNKLKGFELGAVDFISKPFQREELLARINTHLSLQENKEKLIKANKKLLIANESTLENEKKYRSLFNSLVNGFAFHEIVLDENNVPIDYIFIEINDVYEEIIGLKREEIIGKKITEISPDIVNDIIKWIEIYGQVALTGKTRKFESFLESTNKWYSVIVYSAQKNYFAAIFEDITDRKNVEKEIIDKTEELRKQFEKSEKQRIANLIVLNDLNIATKDLKAEITERKRAEQIQKVLYNISNAVIITDNFEELAKRIQEYLGTIIDTTNFYIALYNNKTDTISLPFFSDKKDKYTSVPAGKTLTKYVIDTKKSLLANIDLKKRLVKEGKLEHKGSLSKIWLGVPLKIEGKVIGVLAVQSYTDEYAYNESDMEILEFISGQISISIERKKAEEELQKHHNNLEELVEKRTAELSFANAELAKAAGMKDEFLANMSHELRTPLNAVLGLSEALQEEIYGKLNKKQTEKIQHIEESGRHLLDLINEILDLAKIEAGKIVLEYREISIEELMQSSLRFIKQTAFNKKIKVSTNTSSTIETFRADEKRMKQILVNLLSNAVKFTPDGGQIGLEVNVNKENQTISFIVWDTGIGISQENIDKLFQPFVQIDSTLSRQYEGTGLGLALVNKLTNLHNGSITVGSQEGKGSRFIVTIPIMEYDKKDESELKDSKIDELNAESDVLIVKKDDRKKREGQRLILLAEDNEYNIITIKDYLEAKQFKVLVARNGKEAVAMVNEIKPELILMDIQMPVMNGLEATKEIRANSNSKISGIPIIALTSLAMPGDREKCINAGANKYMKKPVGLKNLVKTINDLLEKKA